MPRQGIGKAWPDSAGGIGATFDRTTAVQGEHPRRRNQYALAGQVRAFGQRLYTPNALCSRKAGQSPAGSCATIQSRRVSSRDLFLRRINQFVDARVRPCRVLGENGIGRVVSPPQPAPMVLRVPGLIVPDRGARQILAPLAKPLEEELDIRSILLFIVRPRAQKIRRSWTTESQSCPSRRFR